MKSGVTLKKSVALDFQPLSQAGSAPATFAMAAPRLPAVSSAPRIVAITPDNGFSASDFVTNISRVTIRGSGVAGSRVYIQLDGSNVAAVSVDATGRWQWTGATALSEGQHSLSVFSPDGSGGILSGNSVNVVIDRTAPVGFLAAVDSDNDASDGFTTGGIRPIVSGTAEAGSRLTLILDGVSVASLLTGNDGHWSYRLARDLSDGAHVLRLRVEDRAGNVTHQDAAIQVQPQTGIIDFALSADAGAIDLITNVTAGQTVTGRAYPDGAIVQILNELGQVIGETGVVNRSWTIVLGTLEYGTYRVRLVNGGSEYDAQQDILISHTVAGTLGNDTILAFSDDSISGLAGSDRLESTGQRNVLSGGTGSDLLIARQFDTLSGGDGHDSLVSNVGNNTLYGDGGNDTLTGRLNDHLEGGGGNDLLLSLSRDNTLSGGIGNDSLRGNQFDLLEGNEGDDTLTSAGDRNFLSGGVGNDRLLANFQDTLLGGEGSDTVSSSQGSNNLLSGDAGNDLLIANVRDTLMGGDGDDTLSVSPDVASNKYAVLYGGGGNDLLFAFSSTLDGGDGDDTITSIPLPYFTSGSYGAGVNLGFGGVGNDNIIAGGLDTYYGGDGSDTLTAYDTNNILRGEGDGDYLSLRPNSYGFNTLDGGNGDDTIIGGGRYDNNQGHSRESVFVGGDGNDVISTGGMRDTLEGGGNDDRLISNNDGVENFLLGGGGRDFLSGNDRDTLAGGSGEDTIDATGTNIVVRLDDALSVDRVEHFNFAADDRIDLRSLFDDLGIGNRNIGSGFDLRSNGPDYELVIDTNNDGQVDRVIARFVNPAGMNAIDPGDFIVV